jgi:hypothetical protein
MKVAQIDKTQDGEEIDDKTMAIHSPRYTSFKLERLCVLQNSTGARPTGEQEARLEHMALESKVMVQGGIRRKN